MSELVTLRCPNCGAPIHAGEATCEYCGAALYVGQAAEVALPAVAEAQKMAAQMRERIAANAYDGEAYYRLGLACFTLRLYDQAENAFQQAARFLPGSALPHYFTALAIVHGAEQEILSVTPFRLNQARRELTTAARIDPNFHDAQAYFQLVDGLLARNAGDYQGALKPLREAVKALPTLDLGWKALAACLFQVGRYEEAVEAGLRALKLHPNDEGDVYLVGAAYGRLGNADKMTYYAREAARLRGDPDGWERVVKEYHGEFE